MTSARKLTAALLATCTALTMASCSSNGDKSADSGKSADSTSAKATNKDSGKDTNSGKPVRVWFMEGSISEDAQNYLKTEFKKENPGMDISIEIQPWQNNKAKLQTALASKDQAPDIVEIGAAPDKLAVAGALLDISDMYKELGGKSLIPSFTEGGMYDGKHFAYPLYGGVRGVFYRKDLFKAANIKVPQTLTELKDAAIALEKANPDKVDNFSGIYLAGIDFHALESYLYAMGGRYAVQEDGKWTGTMTKPDAQKALKQMQEIFKDGTHFALDSQAGQKQFQNYFNNGQVGILIATGNIGQKIDKKLWDADKVGVMALPSETPGVVGASYAGGSNVAITKNGLNHAGAKAAMKIIFSQKFQTLLAESGWIPGNLDYADKVSGKLGPLSKSIMEKAIQGPATVNMGVFHREHVLQNFWARIAKLEDPKAAAEALDKRFDEELNKPVK